MMVSEQDGEIFPRKPFHVRPFLGVCCLTFLFSVSAVSARSSAASTLEVNWLTFSLMRSCVWRSNGMDNGRRGKGVCEIKKGAEM